jgi:hypothetical protein
MGESLLTLLDELLGLGRYLGGWPNALLAALAVLADVNPVRRHAGPPCRLAPWLIRSEPATFTSLL